MSASCAPRVFRREGWKSQLKRKKGETKEEEIGQEGKRARMSGKKDKSTKRSITQLHRKRL